MCHTWSHTWSPLEFAFFANCVLLFKASPQNCKGLLCSCTVLAHSDVCVAPAHPTPTPTTTTSTEGMMMRGSKAEATPPATLDVDKNPKHGDKEPPQVIYVLIWVFCTLPPE